MADIEWTGDIEDDCFAAWNGYTAHAECLYAYDPDDVEPGDSPNDPESWFAAVYQDGDGPPADRIVFHSTGYVVPLSGAAARRLCELIMRAAAAGVDYRLIR